MGVIASVDPVANGTADNAKFYDSDDNYHFLGTVGETGTPDVLLGSLTIAVGIPVDVSTGTIYL